MVPKTKSACNKLMVNRSVCTEHQWLLKKQIFSMCSNFTLIQKMFLFIATLCVSIGLVEFF